MTLTLGHFDGGIILMVVTSFLTFDSTAVRSALMA